MRIYKTLAWPISISERVVVCLVGSLLNTGPEITLDNWYISVRVLLSQDTNMIGTIRNKQGVSSELAKMALEPC